MIDGIERFAYIYEDRSLMFACCSFFEIFTKIHDCMLCLHFCSEPKLFLTQYVIFKVPNNLSLNSFL